MYQRVGQFTLVTTRNSPEEEVFLVFQKKLKFCFYVLLFCTVESRSTDLDTRLIRTPRYYGQFCLSQRKAHTFLLKITRLLRTPVNTDNGHFSMCRVTN